MRYVVTLDLILNEDVSPGHTARRVAEACAKYNALREGESVRAHLDPDGPVYTISNETTPSPFA